MEAGRAGGVRIYSCSKAALKDPSQWCRMALESGLDGCIFYESASLVKLNADGIVECTLDSVPQAIREFRKKRRS